MSTCCPSLDCYGVPLGGLVDFTCALFLPSESSRRHRNLLHAPARFALQAQSEHRAKVLSDSHTTERLGTNSQILGYNTVKGSRDEGLAR